MALKEHIYQSELRWTGNKGEGTLNYQAYDRTHVISLPGKPEIAMSSDPAFRGDTTKHNPEELLVASLSSCHMLWYLHLCADAGITVVDYKDAASGIMTENPDGSGQFREVVLHPRVKVLHESMIGPAQALHIKAHEKCFIARSCNFPVRHEPECSC